MGMLGPFFYNIKGFILIGHMEYALIIALDSPYFVFSTYFKAQSRRQIFFYDTFLNILMHRWFATKYAFPPQPFTHLKI